MTSTPDRIPLRHRQYEKASATLAITLTCMSVFGPFSMDTVFPAFKQIGAQMHATDATMQQLVSVYLLAFAVMSILHGAISDAVGRKPVVIVGSLLYMVASIGCAVSGTLTSLLIFRACQGATAGAGMIISRAVVRDLFEGSEAQRQMSLNSMIFSIAPALAPVIGGWILLAGPWPYIFFFLSLWGGFVAILVALTLPESLPKQQRQSLRFAPLAKGLVDVARHGQFQILSLALIFLFASQFLFISSAPLFVRNILGLGEQDFWMMFVPLILGILIGARLQGKLAGVWKPERLVLLGIGIVGVTGALNLIFALVPATSAKLPWAVLAPMGIALGVQIAFPVITIMILDLFPERRGAASSMQSFEQLLFNAGLAGFIAPIATQTIVTMATTALIFMGIGVFFFAIAWHMTKAHRAANVVVDDLARDESV